MLTATLVLLLWSSVTGNSNGPIACDAAIHGVLDDGRLVLLLPDPIPAPSPSGVIVGFPDSEGRWWVAHPQNDDDDVVNQWLRECLR